MMLQTKLKIVRDLLVNICPNNCYHYFRAGMAVPYVVWAEDNEPASLRADNHKKALALHGFIDYFTKKEFDPVIDRINDALNESEDLTAFISFVEFEQETNVIHYQWEFEVR